VTTSLPAIRCCNPSRITRARGLDRFRSASHARSVFRSWYTVIPMMRMTKLISIRLSVTSPRTKYNIPPVTSRRNIGSWTTSMTIRRRPRFDEAGSSLYPSRWILSFTSSLVRQDTEVISRVAIIEPDVRGHGQEPARELNPVYRGHFVIRHRLQL
jgi:hypothetical protein